MPDLKTSGVLDRAEDLPAFPLVVNKLNRLLANPNTRMAEIAKVIAMDQAIAVRLIRWVNSAYYGLSRRVDSIHQAIVLLGLNTVKNLVYGVSILRVFDSVGHSAQFDPVAFWKNSLACAMCCENLAKAVRLPHPENLFLGGLCRDVGVLVLCRLFPEKFGEIMALSDSEKIPYSDAESRILVHSHCQVGAALARRWNLPEYLGEIMAFHHHPDRTPPESAHRTMVAVVHVADLAVRRMGIGAWDSGLPEGVELRGLELLNMREKEVEDCLGVVPEQLNRTIREWGLGN